jgi:type IV pilus assembly protein PilE
LILIAFPIVTPLFQKARSQEAKLNLSHLVGLQKVYYMEHAKYSTNIADIGFEHNAMESEGGKANYKVEIKEANEANFKASATAVKDFDGDGTFNIWEIDKSGIAKEVTPD